MTQQQGQEESDQKKNDDEWRGAGSSGWGAARPFRGQKTDQQWSVHRVTLSHRGSPTSTSVPLVIIRTL